MRQPKQRKPVGSSKKASRKFGGKTDFGIPASRSKSEFARRKSREAKFQPSSSKPSDPRRPKGSLQQSRTSGVGKSDAGPGGSSGGDVDTDIVGLDGRGLAQSGPDRDDTSPRRQARHRP